MCLYLFVFRRSEIMKFSNNAPVSWRMDRELKLFSRELRMPRSQKYIFRDFIISLRRFLLKEIIWC